MSTRRRSIVALLVALALIAAACSDDDAATASAAVATTQAPGTTQAPATTIAPEAATTTPPTTAPQPITTTTEAPRVDPATALIGVWRLHSGYMTFQDDGIWTYQVLLSVEVSNNGGYAFEDGVLTFTTDLGSCVGTGEGIYEVVFLSQDEMAWTEVSDECSGRRYLIVETVPGVQIQETIPRHMP